MRAERHNSLAAAEQYRCSNGELHPVFHDILTTAEVRAKLKNLTLVRRKGYPGTITCVYLRRSWLCRKTCCPSEFGISQRPNNDNRRLAKTSAIRFELSCRIARVDA